MSSLSIIDQILVGACEVSDLRVCVWQEIVTLLTSGAFANEQTMRS